MRHPKTCRLNQTINQHPGTKIGTYQFQQPLVSDFAGDPHHQSIMVDRVEELFEINIHGDLTAILNVLPKLTNSVVCRTVGPKAKTALGKCWVKDRLQHLRYGLLDNPVDDRWYAQLSFSALRLRYGFASDWVWLISPIDEGLAYLGPMLFGKVGKGVQCHSIDTGCTFVGPHSFPCFVHVGRFQYAS